MLLSWPKMLLRLLLMLTLMLLSWMKVLLRLLLFLYKKNNFKNLKKKHFLHLLKEKGDKNLKNRMAKLLITWVELILRWQGSKISDKTKYSKFKQKASNLEGTWLPYLKFKNKFEPYHFELNPKNKFRAFWFLAFLKCYFCSNSNHETVGRLFFFKDCNGILFKRLVFLVLDLK